MKHSSCVLGPYLSMKAYQCSCSSAAVRIPPGEEGSRAAWVWVAATGACMGMMVMWAGRVVLHAPCYKLASLHRNEATYILSPL